MSSKPVLAEVSAVINGGEYSPTSLRLSLDVDTFPSVVADVTTNPDKVQTPLAKETIDRINALQQERLAGRTKPDFKLSAGDGIGGRMTYQGFTTAPLLNLSKVSTLDRLSSVGVVALLDALDLSIYAASYDLERAEAGSDLKPIKAAENGDVTGTIASITKTLVGNYDLSLANEHAEVSKEILRLQHQVNTDGPLKLWLAILGASRVKYDSWDAAFKASPAIARHLSERIRDFLEAQSSGFWAQVQGLMQNFQMFYVPDFDGPGRFVRADRKVAEPTEEIAASVMTLDLVDGSTRILQPGGVVMMMRGSTAERQESQPDPTIPRVVAYAPDPLRPGFIHREPPPFWLLREEGIPIFGSEVDTRPPSQTQVNLDLAKRKAAAALGRQFKSKVDTVSSGVMTELCEVIFKNLQLAQSTVTIGTPLNYRANRAVGRRVIIEVRRNSRFWAGRKFTAFVQGVSHSVSLNQGKQMSASTELRLSHVDYRAP